jgi:hypothetical protein
VAEELYDYADRDSVMSRDACLVEQMNVVDDPARATARDHLRRLMDQTLTTPPPVQLPDGSTVPDRKKKKKQP